MSRLHWFGLRIWFCTLQLAEKASCTDPAVIPGCIEQVYLYKPSVPIRPIEAICTKPGWYSRLYRIRLYVSVKHRRLDERALHQRMHRGADA